MEENSVAANTLAHLDNCRVERERDGKRWREGER